VASTVRHPAGAIGVALFGDIYLNRCVALLHLPSVLPAVVVHIARQSVGAANAVAARLPAQLAAQVRSQAHAAFVSGLDWTTLIAAMVARAGPVCRWRSCCPAATQAHNRQASSGIMPGRRPATRRHTA
jgi:MFS transporter, DHA2 family, multidrug resistance protein